MTDLGDKASGCEQFQSLLPELLSKGEDVYIHPHAQSCELCRALIVDLERIAEESRRLKLNRRDEGDEDEDGTTRVRSR